MDDEAPLFRITAMAPLRARLLVPESEMHGFVPAAPVRLSSPDGPVGTARVILVGPTTDPGSATREVIVELSDVGNFRPGASVSAKVYCGKRPLGYVLLHDAFAYVRQNIMFRF